MAEHKHNQRNYVIDTNILINFDIFTPQKIHKKFWANMEAAIDSGNIIIIKDVADECKHQSIKKLVDGLDANGKIVKVSSDIRARALEINDEFNMITTVGQDASGSPIIKSEADPVIIAYAEANKYTVFTRESKRGPRANQSLGSTIRKPMKIPAVCDALGVDCERSPVQVLPNIMPPI